MKRAIWITSCAAILLLLAGAAFAGARQLSGAGGDIFVPESSVGILEKIAISVETVPAAEMPDLPADVAGVFVRREDSNLFLGTGNTSGLMTGGAWELHHNGPTVEVVTNDGTRIFQDHTLLQLGGAAPSGPVKQILRLGDLHEIGPNSTVSTWGEKRGDRFVAEIIIYTNQLAPR